MDITPPKAKSQKWSTSTIWRILSQEAYSTGKLHYYKNKAVESKRQLSIVTYKRVVKSSRETKPKSEWKEYYKIEPIVDESLFKKAQKLLSYNKDFKNKRSKNQYLLTGIIYCQCGSRRVGDGSSKQGHYYYRCSSKASSRHSKQPCQFISRVNANMLDQVVWSQIEGTLTNPYLMKTHAEEWIRRQTLSTFKEDKEVDRLSNHLGIVRAKKQRLIQIYRDGKIDYDEFTSEVKVVNSDISLLDHQIKQLQLAKSSHISDEIDINALCQEAKKVLNSQSQTDKHQLIHELVEKITTLEGNKVQVHIHVPFSTLKLGYESKNRNCGAAKCGQIHLI